MKTAKMSKLWEAKNYKFWHRVDTFGVQSLLFLTFWVVKVLNNRHSSLQIPVFQKSNLSKFQSFEASYFRSSSFKKVKNVIFFNFQFFEINFSKIQIFENFAFEFSIFRIPVFWTLRESFFSTFQSFIITFSDFQIFENYAFKFFFFEVPVFLKFLFSTFWHFSFGLRTIYLIFT